jgi:ribosomal protein S18 acetylase RimI-like enzyme
MPDSIMLIYREATAADILSICIFVQAVNLLHHEAWPQLFSSASDTQLYEAHWRKSIENSSSTTFVVQTQNKIIGFVTVNINSSDSNPLLHPVRFAHVNSICVAMGFHGLGIGRKLMSLAEHWGATKGAADIRLSVWSFNLSALQLYEELGYEIRSNYLGKALTQNETL